MKCKNYKIKKKKACGSQGTVDSRHLYRESVTSINREKKIHLDYE